MHVRARARVSALIAIVTATLRNSSASSGSSVILHVDGRSDRRDTERERERKKKIGEFPNGRIVAMKLEASEDPTEIAIVTFIDHFLNVFIIRRYARMNIEVKRVKRVGAMKRINYCCNSVEITILPLYKSRSLMKRPS